MNNRERILYPQPQFLGREKRPIVFRSGYPIDRFNDGILTWFIDGLAELGIELNSKGVVVRPYELKKGPKHDFSVALQPFSQQLIKLLEVGAITQETRAQFPDNVVNVLQQSPPYAVGAVDLNGGFLNIDLDYPVFAGDVLSSIEIAADSYGAENIGQGRIVVIDMSSPNIAKPMHPGHLRSTIIGESLSRILEFTGYNVIKDNHLGDWGAQFGLVLKAIELWGSEYPELEIEGKEVEGLLLLYQRINSESEKEKESCRTEARRFYYETGQFYDPVIENNVNEHVKRGLSQEEAIEKAHNEYDPDSTLELAGKEWFRRLEQGDLDAIKQWQRITQLSSEEFREVYRILGIKFDLELGESYYSPMLGDVIDDLIRHSDFVRSENGAVIADLNDQGLGELPMRTTDGRSLYATREIAGAFFRQNVLKADRQIYVVGGDQQNYFKQVFALLKKMGLPIADQSVHIPFGLVKDKDGHPFSTRAGNIVGLRYVIEEMCAKAYEEIKTTKIPDEKRRRDIAKQVAIGALIWADLSQGMGREIKFDLEEILAIEENTGPYVQYARARSAGILRMVERLKLKINTNAEIIVDFPEEKQVIKLLAEFPNVVKTAGDKLEPKGIARYLTDLSHSFNSLYDAKDENDKQKIRVISINDQGETTVDQTRLRIAQAVSQVLKNGLYLLGIEAPEKM